MAASIDCVLQNDLKQNILACKVLVVGAGGVGCELLKNLVQTGFQDIELIDLDTIDLSNLNRQFLFRKEHIGKSKAMVARESAISFNSNAKIISHHASIMNSEYNAAYFKRFTIVLNALDNKAARNHVNRMCLAADVPLIESGTAGYLGQVTVICKNVSECYECTSSPSAKTYPGCTIRNTPSELIHCIVWAKHLFNQLFGEFDDIDDDVSPDTADPEASGDKVGLNAMNKEQLRISTRDWAEKNNYNITKILTKIFKDDILYLLSMSNLWIKRMPPSALTSSIISTALNNPDEECHNNGTTTSSTPCEDLYRPLSTTKSSLIPEQRVPLSSLECIRGLQLAVKKCHERFTTRGQPLVWDKDDTSSLDFVVHAANLRAHIFHINMKSKFDIKSMAGNIIPAIATTNAIIAGLIVMEALKLVRVGSRKGQTCMEGDEEETVKSQCRQIYLMQMASDRGKLLKYFQLDPPNPRCYVCSDKPEIYIKLNTLTMTLQVLQDKVLKNGLGMVAPDVEIDNGKGTILLSSDFEETEDNLPKLLKEFGVGDNTRLKCDDFQQIYNVNVTLVHVDKCPDNADYEIIGDQFKLQEYTSKLNTKKDTTTSHKGEDDGVMLMEEDSVEETGEEVAQVLSESRKRKGSDADQKTATKIMKDSTEVIDN